MKRRTLILVPTFWFLLLCIVFAFWMLFNFFSYDVSGRVYFILFAPYLLAGLFANIWLMRDTLIQSNRWFWFCLSLFIIVFVLPVFWLVISVILSTP